jgi:hypothetical protein
LFLKLYICQRRSNASSQEKVSPSVTSNNKKDCIVETADIGGLTLMFQDRPVELKWQQNQMKRNFGISQRFLFFSAIFQGLFFWSDIIEQQETKNHSYALQLCCMRILLGGLSLLCCFLVSTGLLLPTQMMVCPVLHSIMYSSKVNFVLIHFILYRSIPFYQRYFGSTFYMASPHSLFFS